VKIKVTVAGRKFRVKVTKNSETDFTYKLFEIINGEKVLLSDGLTYGSEALESAMAESMEDIGQHILGMVTKS